MASDVPHPVPAETYNSADPEQVERRRNEAAQRELRMRKVVADLMHTPEGRAWIWRELEGCHIYAVSFEPGIDAATVAFREGERNRGLALLAQVLASAPGFFLMMQREAAGE